MVRGPPPLILNQCYLLPEARFPGFLSSRHTCLETATSLARLHPRAPACRVYDMPHIRLCGNTSRQKLSQVTLLKSDQQGCRCGRLLQQECVASHVDGTARDDITQFCQMTGRPLKSQAHPSSRLTQHHRRSCVEDTAATHIVRTHDEDAKRLQDPGVDLLTRSRTSKIYS